MKTGLLALKVYHKPSALKRPLGIASAHPASIHTCWPQGMAMRAHDLCNSRSSVTEELAHLHRWFAASFGREWATEALAPKLSAECGQSTKPDITSYLVPPFRKDFAWGNVRAILKRQEEEFSILLN